MTARVTARVTARTLAITCAVLGLAIARPAAAHPLDIGYLRITADGARVAVALDVHVNAAARMIGADPAMLDAAELQRRAAELADASFRAAPIVLPETTGTATGACTWTTATATLTDRTVRLTSDASCPTAVHAIQWAFPFLTSPRASPTFQLLVKAELAGESRVAIVDKARPSLALSVTAAIGLATFVWTGVEHIGAAPDQWNDAEGWKLPDGIDHILFLFALMLAGGSLLQILAIVSGFTLGHSITLALSALHVVRPPAALIEPLIALTIVFVAAQTVRGKTCGRHRWRIATCFGLIHGFGFASALNQMNLSTGDLVQALFGYNLGVELGQVTIVLIAAPLLLHLHRHPRYHGIVRGLAAVICLAGTYWFVQRLGLG
jgi:hypothetical protein